MPEPCPLCGQYGTVLTPSLGRCNRSSCDVLTFRLDRPQDKTLEQAALQP